MRDDRFVPFLLYYFTLSVIIIVPADVGRQDPRDGWLFALLLHISISVDTVYSLIYLPTNRSHRRLFILLISIPCLVDVVFGFWKKCKQLRFRGFLREE